MKRYLILLSLVFLIGCPTPYRDVVFDQLKTTRQVIDIGNQTGVTLRDLGKFGSIAEKEVKAAMTDLAVQHKITNFLLEQYMATGGVYGYATIEIERKKLYMATEKAANVIAKHLNRSNDNNEAFVFVEMWLELPPEQRAQVVRMIGAHKDGNK